MTLESAESVVEWLLSSAGQEIWHSLRAEQVSREHRLKTLAELRKSLPAEHAAQAIQLAALQTGLRDKFETPMLAATERSMQQATDQWIAQYKASRFPLGSHVFDLCSGMGGDAMALSQRYQITVVDSDSVLCKFAAYNISQLGSKYPVQIACADVCNVDLKNANAWHIDPDRRPNGGRTVRLEDSQPDLSVLLRLLEQNANACWKLAPACEVPPEIGQNAEREWVSRKGECKQQVLWFGNLTSHRSMRSATKVGAKNSIVGTFRWSTVSPDVESISGLQAYLYEPDCAVLAGNGAAALASEVGLRRLIPGGGYLTSDALHSHSMLRCYKVLEHMPFRDSKISAYLKQHDAGIVHVKKRGIDIEPAALAKAFRGKGNAEFVVIGFRQGKKAMAAITQECTL